MVGTNSVKSPRNKRQTHTTRIKQISIFKIQNSMIMLVHIILYNYTFNNKYCIIWLYARQNFSVISVVRLVTNSLQFNPSNYDRIRKLFLCSHFLDLGKLPSFFIIGLSIKQPRLHNSLKSVCGLEYNMPVIIILFCGLSVAGKFDQDFVDLVLFYWSDSETNGFNACSNIWNWLKSL
jgi:hypothetical protein